MRIRHFDCYLHELDITDAVGRPDRAAADHVAAALAEPVASLGYIVGKKAAFPRDRQMRIRLTGPVEATLPWSTTPAGARVVDALDGRPTAAITLDAVLFLRLTGGRLDPTAHLDEIDLDGDPELARHLATHLAFTI